MAAKKPMSPMSEESGYKHFSSPYLFQQLKAESRLPKDASDIDPELAMPNVRRLREKCSDAYTEIKNLRKVRRRLRGPEGCVCARTLTRLGKWGEGRLPATEGEKEAQ